MELSLATALEAVARARAACSPDRAAVVSISGIDGSGKGYVTDALAGALSNRGTRVAPIHIDPWLSAPEIRHSALDPGRHFYQHAFPFERIFERLIEPLRRDRRICSTETLTGQHGVPETVVYEWADVDVVLVEGIFLLKRELVARYDVRLWIDCSFETALERALARNQEGLPPDAIVRDYHTIYFPAQEEHFRRDAPREKADEIVVNDHRIVHRLAAPAGQAAP